MKTKVLLINLPYTIKHIDITRPKVRSFYAFPLGLLSVATYCRDLADIKLLDLGNHAPDAAIQVVKTYLDEEGSPDIVGFSMGYDNSYGCLEDLAGIVKDFDPNILVVLGGSAASYNYAEILEEQEDIDAICFGEGEIPFRELLITFLARDYFLFHANSAWATRYNLDRHGAPNTQFIQNLDEVIDIDYSFVNPADYSMQEAFSPYARPNRKCFFLMSSRGCPYDCQFCSNSAIHGKKIRYASVGRIVDHVKYLIDTYGLETLVVYDDQILSNMNRAKDLFNRLIPLNIRVELPNGVSIAFIDEEMAGLMKAAGVDTVYLALESGSEYVLEKLIKKPLKLKQVKPAVDALRKFDLYIHGFLVMGMPGEGIKHRNETIDFLREIDLDWYGFNYATPVKGSKLYEDCVKQGWIKKKGIQETVDKDYIIDIPGVDRTTIIEQVEWMNRDFNFYHNRRMRIGDYETAAKAFQQVIDRYEGHELAKHYLGICEKRIKERG